MIIDTDKFKDVTRVEIIDAEGRSYTKYGVTAIGLQVQDEGRTLKIFLHEGSSSPVL